MRSLLAAIRCLTIIPVPCGDSADQGLIARSRYWYPALGLVIGIFLGYVGTAAVGVLGGRLIAAAATVTVWVILTGALHLDGLADSFDGVFARGAPDRRLEIMRDPHMGTFGVAVLVLCLLLKTAALASLGASRLAPTLAGAGVAGRGAILLVAGLSRYARPAGTGRAVIESAGLVDVVWGGCWMLAVAALLHWPADLLAMAVVALGAAAWAGLCRLRLGGATGDCLGAACELGETAYIVVGTVALPSSAGLVARWLGGSPF